MKLLRSLAVLLLAGLAAMEAAAQVLPLQQDQDATLFNFQSLRGVPLSNTNGFPVGSDGRAPSPGAGLTGTAGQFQGFLSFGAVVRPTNNASLNTSTNYAGNAVTLGLPRGTNNLGNVNLVLNRAHLGNPFATRPVSFLFGEVITPPDKDEYGIDLSLPNPNKGRPNPVLPSDYWWREPINSADTASGCYYSPHAERIFASQVGNAEIVWQRTEPSILQAGAISGAGNLFARGANRNVLTNRYVIAATPIKPTRRMYWTEGSFQGTGKPIDIPTARVQEIKVIYNDRVPRSTSEVLINGSRAGTLEITNTLWLETSVNQLRAYNVEGKAMVELLGDLRPEAGTGIRQQIGYELVEISQRPSVDEDVTTELGETITPYQEATPEGTPSLTAEPLLQSIGTPFDYRHSVPGTTRLEYYAVRETQTQDDYLVHWMETSIAGLRWPYRYVRYKFVWPTEVSKYTHFLRPAVDSSDLAKTTAVPLPADNAPFIAYQDALDQPRGALTENFAYYSWLTPAYPAHRALLRFNAAGYVRFERVFSWLDQTLRGQLLGDANFAGTVATNLSAWTTNQVFVWPDESVRPRLTTSTVFVGDRITAPPGEIGDATSTNYLAGYIRESEGNLFHPGAYLNPFVSGFDLASQGAIIPVNAIPGHDLLEVWWFRRNQVDTTRGFKPVLWPAVIGRYTIQWPTHPSEIILASNDGSGPLPSLEAKGSVYYQNDSTKAGYNPNEEHALMQGGQVYALRDDLNQTNVDNYSSASFVLLQFTAADGRPAVRPFRVRREDPAAAVTFEYNKVAGSILQPPMPLPLLGPTFAPKLPGQPRQVLTEEWTPIEIRSSSIEVGAPPDSWTLQLGQGHGLPAFHSLILQDARLANSAPRWLFVTDVQSDRVHGVISTNRPYTLTSLGGGATANLWRFQAPLDTVNAFAGWANRSVLIAARTSDSNVTWTVQVSGISTSPSPYVEVDFGSPAPTILTNPIPASLIQPVSGYASGAFDHWRVAWNEGLSGGPGETRELYSKATLADRKGNLWVYRGPHLADRPETFAVRYYYRTMAGFYFPSLAANAQPPVGTATPYLRAQDASGQFIGSAVFGNANNDQRGDQNALSILYHPVWPEQPPVLQMAETLLTPKRGLPAVRGQTSLQILYQQSHVTAAPQQQPTVDTARHTVLLHDPTREKVAALDLDLLPKSIKTEVSRGKIWFPNLPPHLVKRFYLDPNRGENGILVFMGEFVDSPLGDDYVFLNVAGPQDENTLRALCLDDDPQKDLWDDTVRGLTATIDQFVENAGKPGTFDPTPTPRFSHIEELAEIKNQDEAVDSYALTAVGPYTGYVSLIAGNGSAFTPEGDPVSIQVLRVSPRLYRGEVNVVESENPLNERLTLQQVVDLGGKTENYVFDWRITAPVDGLPPAIYKNTPVLLPLEPWTHLRQVNATDRTANQAAIDANRLASDVSATITPVTEYHFDAVIPYGDYFFFVLNSVSLPHHLAVGDKLVMSSADGVQVNVTVHELLVVGDSVIVSIDPNQSATLSHNQVFRLSERLGSGPQSLLFSRFVEPAGRNLAQVWLSLNLGSGLAARVYLDGGLVTSVGFPSGNSVPNNPPTDLANPKLTRSFRLPASVLSGGTTGASGDKTHTMAVELFTTAAAAAPLDFAARLEAYDTVDQVTTPSTVWLALDTAQYEDGVRAVVGGAADVRSLSDNYLTMRYRPESDPNGWSQWTEPQLAEGWIKRVLKGINPFNQRVSDLFSHSVNTDVSLLTQAGPRWEGDIALNLDSINNYGLIEIYETVLNRGKMISIGGGINYGPANDALLLAGGYINDLYMLAGNEAAADAANPTIGIGTKDNTYGAIATALFSFKGQLPSLLEEELALLRGRDDFLLPGVETPPVYNRLVWNYTRGIDAGEVIYALNYNVLDQNGDGKVDADDARRLYPQGHGDAYGHYLTALKTYYQLFLDRNFDWVPRSEAVLVLGKPVSVDYADERKWAAAAGALARAGRQIFDLTWRRDYQSGPGHGWSHLRSTRSSNKRTQYWGADHWAARTGQGAYFNWIVGNAVVPEIDPDPSHRNTIQQIDRTTVPELAELPTIAESLQSAMDSAEGSLTPLGLPENTVPFDLNPNVVVGSDNQTHFEQIYNRARTALNNAIVAFDDAKDVTRLMRSEQDSLIDFRTAVDKQELAYTNSLIELFGTPYPEDIGPGKTYRSGFAGPDTVHYMYIDNVELEFRDPYGNSLLAPSEPKVWKIDTQTFTADWLDENQISEFNFIRPAFSFPIDGTGQTSDYGVTNYVEYTLASHGYFSKPSTWIGKRSSPGRLQQAISDVAKARNAAFTAFYWADAAKYDLDWAIQAFNKKKESHSTIRDWQTAIVTLEQINDTATSAYEIADKYLEETKEQLRLLSTTALQAIPTSLIAGVAAGGDLFSGVRGAVLAGAGTIESVTDWSRVIGFSVVKALELANSTAARFIEFSDIQPEEWNQELRDATSEIRDKVYGMNNHFMTINQRLQELDDAQRKLRSMLAEGDRIQQEREIFRRRTAAVIQGYRTRDAAFRIFRNEKLERYKTLFDLAARYSFMAAQAYDYETGLLGTADGRSLIKRIVNARALGVVQNGQPQFAGSNTGDPGLSSVLAEMQADWQVVKGRLGFNNPDAYGTTLSLRYENFRITTNDVTWQNVLQQARRENLLDDPDVRRSCLQIGSPNGTPVPGLLLEFSSTIADGLNFFGRPLAAGDHAFNPASFATKIFAVGVALEGYVGMSDPDMAGGQTSPDPSLIYLDPNALSATPYIYLIPVGVDSMRSPALGDTSDIRSWNVADVAIPLPFNLGGSDFSSTRLWQSSDSLTEDPFAVRKHQSFRPVSSSTLFDPSIYTGSGGLQRSQFTNNRLIGRSAWNSRWKVVIPARTLLNDPQEGLERFIRTVHDLRLHFVTYSYSGN